MRDIVILDATGKEYDPERTLWKPGRRAFFFLGLGAAVAPFLPDVAVIPGWDLSVYGIKNLSAGESVAIWHPWPHWPQWTIDRQVFPKS